MYSFKLKHHVFGCLILALLLVILLCHFVPVASAAETQMYLYNGVELPELPEWDYNKYPFAFIAHLDGSYTTLNVLSGQVYFASSSLRASSDLERTSYSLTDGEWVENTPSTTNAGAVVNYKGRHAIWANFDILNEDGSVYLAASNPVPVGGSGPSDPSEPSGAVLPVFTVQPPLIPWVEYDVGNTPTSVTVEAVVDDGGTISYIWYRTIYAESGAPSLVVFSTGATLVPDTSVVSDSSYYCVATNTNGEFSRSAYSRSYRVKVLESGAADPPSETPTFPSADDIGSSVGDAFQGVLDQNDINTSEQGNSFVDQITQIVPNDSQGFVNAMGGLVDSLSYGGTECVLTVPALVMPQIGALVPQYTLLEKQTVDLESYFNMFPDFIVTLVQSLFTVALIVFCFKELYSTVSYFFVLRGGET